MLKKFAVILPVKNEENFLSTCLESLLSQSRKPDEIVIVLDRCTDQTPQIAALYSKKYSTISVTSMPWSQYQGRLFRAHRIAELANEGIKSTGGQYDFIMVANADTLYSEGYLEEALEVMMAEPSCVITGWLLGRNISGSGIIYRKSFMDKATGGLVKECFNEELYMQMKAKSMGFKIIPLEKAKGLLLRQTAHGNLDNRMMEAIRDGYAMYSLGFSFYYTLLRSVVALLDRKFLSALFVPFGYSYSVLSRVYKLDVAYTNIPLEIQYERISMILRNFKYQKK